MWESEWNERFSELEVELEPNITLIPAHSANSLRVGNYLLFHVLSLPICFHFLGAPHALLYLKTQYLHMYLSICSNTSACDLRTCTDESHTRTVELEIRHRCNSLVPLCVTAHIWRQGSCAVNWLGIFIFVLLFCILYFSDLNFFNFHHTILLMRFSFFSNFERNKRCFFGVARAMFIDWQTDPAFG